MDAIKASTFTTMCEETKEQQRRRNKQEEFLEKAERYRDYCTDSPAEETFSAMVSAVEGCLDCPDFDKIMRDANITLKSFMQRVRGRDRNLSLLKWSAKYGSLWMTYCEPFGL